MKRRFYLLAILFLLLFSKVGAAASPWTEETTYLEKMRGKYLFGVANIFGGWVSLIHEPVTHVEDGKNVFVGVGKGIYKSIVITLGGFAHFLTGPLTFLDIPLPDNGVDM